MMMFDLSKVPDRISKKIHGLTWRSDDIGASESTVLLFDEMVLKIEKVNRSSENERMLLGWLGDKLPVPEIIEAETQDGHNFLLMSKLSGEMACSDKSLRNIEDTVKALAAGLRMLWEIGIADCPCTNVVAEKMKQAKYRMENNLVCTEDFSPDTFGSQGFRDVPDLYDYLNQNRPSEEFVFSHGDFCLPNVFVCGRRPTGFLDWGCGGIADRWQDIALCVRSLRHNYMGLAGHGEGEYQKQKALLFQELGIQPNEEKMRYYILLDELF